MEHLFSYRVGFIGWKLAARLGLTLKVVIQIAHDDEAEVYVARSPDLHGLVVEAGTLDELFKEVDAAAGELLNIELGRPNHQTEYLLREGSAFA